MTSRGIGVGVADVVARSMASRREIGVSIADNFLIS